MDRRIVYPGSIPLDIDILSPQQNAMVLAGFLAQATFGAATLFDGLACVPTAPASLSVKVGPGSVISFQPLEATAYGSLVADTADSIMKIGVNRGATTLSFASPIIAGQSQYFLIEGSFLEQDGSPTVLTYYNSSNPAVPFSGPGNSATPQNTVRTQSVNLQIKAGAAAATGTQTIPPVDSGWFGLWVITLQTGQSSITSGSIALYGGAPFVGAKIPALAPINSAALTGLPTSTTPTLGDASTRIATMAALAAATAPLNAKGTGQQVITTSTTFTVPANITRISVSGVAPGGSGGGAYSNAGSLSAGGSGSSGQWVFEQVFAVTAGQVIAVTNANGPAGGAGSTTVGVGGTGGLNAPTASFGALITLTGGSGGGPGIPANTGGGGAPVFGSVGGSVGSGMTSPTVTNGLFRGGPAAASPFGAYGSGGAGGNAGRSGGVTDAADAGQGGGASIFIVQW
jgi:hypothetical protein